MVCIRPLHGRVSSVHAHKGALPSPAGEAAVLQHSPSLTTLPDLPSPRPVLRGVECELQKCASLGPPQLGVSVDGAGPGYAFNDSSDSWTLFQQVNYRLGKFKIK